MERDFVSDRSKSVVRSGIRVMYDLALGVGGLVHLEIGEPDFSTPQHIVAAAKKALDEGYTRYTPNAGYRDLRESVSRKVSRDNGIEADPESEIIITSGAMQAISAATLVTINPGDEVIIPDPAYESFVRQTRFASGIPVPVQVKEEDEFRLTPEKVEQAITKRTKMIIINSPANPTGSVMSKNDLEGIAELAIRHNLLVLSDEIYEKILYDGSRHYSIASFPGMKERTITVFAFSKTYAMTGWRVGYAVAPKSIVGEMTKLQEFYVTCATSICQRAALAALEGPKISSRGWLQNSREEEISCTMKSEGCEALVVSNQKEPSTYSRTSQGPNSGKMIPRKIFWRSVRSLLLPGKLLAAMPMATFVFHSHHQWATLGPLRNECSQLSPPDG